MTHELTLKLTADQINSLVDAVLESLEDIPENRAVLEEVWRAVDVINSNKTGEGNVGTRQNSCD